MRTQCLTRDGFRCVECGKPALVADHVISRRRWLAEGLTGTPDQLGNLRSMCRACDNAVKEGADGERRGGTPRA